MSDPTDAPTTRPYRSRTETIARITEIAGRHLADAGLDALSLRSIAREMDMVPSGIYRHVENRDELLTLLVTDGYRRLADAVEAQIERHPDHPRTAFLAASDAVRAIAVADPHRHALLYGTPVRDYAAPPATTVEAERLYRALLQPLVNQTEPVGNEGEPPLNEIEEDGQAGGAVASPPEAAEAGAPDADTDAGVDAGFDLDRFRALAPGLDAHRAALALDTWAALFGHLSLELFGHLENTVTDPDRFFTRAMRRHADRLGLRDPAGD